MRALWAVLALVLLLGLMVWLIAWTSEHLQHRLQTVTHPAAQLSP
jgi:hypothetical protein